jgi:hypothetical protein
MGLAMLSAIGGFATFRMPRHSARALIVIAPFRNGGRQ